MGILESMGVVIIAAVLVLTVLAILRIPVKMVFRLLINTVVGFIALLLINSIGGVFGLVVAVNWTNAVIIGVFGVSGVALLLLLNWFFGL